MWRVLLLILTAFCIVSTIAGFVYLVPGGAQGWSRDLLEDTPFDSYLSPGIILLVVVGGTRLLAFVLLLLRRASAAFWTAVAGFAMGALRPRAHERGYRPKNDLAMGAVSAAIVTAMRKPART